ncbi:ROK family transcriptional regulator [Actinophytocola algeriensis]|uniref:Putative NBD/HSP70 family sugar kinase n=1 Tax=Actinophytocola algeriensis TaxID=1768010 RepID=A0A7W7VD45_9PSEU|nr:ROK family transcriptional regulator [Actinophytocola algeriensis]MBB4905833.1 putative NBD/HSP70 family sugar kinase [Actinophytocola algeriensis]MBE1472482.1 putative NBD/HSP70 family sugar kinase [Actinophytocola algeriensis]
MAERHPQGTRVLRRINTAAVLAAVRDADGPVRLTELVELTGLTRPTVTQAVEELLDSGWLQQHAAEPSSLGGRPAVRVSLNGRAAPVLGLDVGPHTVTAGVADLAGEQLAVTRKPVRRKGTTHLLAVIDAVTEEALAAADVTAGRVAMVAIGTPGIVDGEKGRVLFAPSIPGWSSIDLVDHLRARFRCAVGVENDANLAALAVAHGRDGTLLAVQWGERLGAGVVIDGRLHRGAGEAGEIGFIRPPGHNPRDDDGRGPLERTIGAEAITALARAAGGARLDTAADAAEVFAAAADGDPAALDVVDRVARTFAEAVAPSVLVLSPHAIVISGGVARAGAVLLDAIRRHLEDLTLTPPALELSDLAEHTVLTGALRMALDRVWRQRLAT